MPYNLTDDESKLVHVKACHNQAIPEPLFTNFSFTLWRHQGQIPVTKREHTDHYMIASWEPVGSSFITVSILFQWFCTFSVLDDSIKFAIMIPVYLMVEMRRRWFTAVVALGYRWFFALFQYICIIDLNVIEFFNVMEIFINLPQDKPIMLLAHIL